MKKILSILLITIYSAATFGMSVKEFYCCGKLTSVSISFNNIGKEKQTKDDGCCKTKFHFSKVKDSHVASHAVTFNAKHFAYSDIEFSALNSFTFTNAPLDASGGIHDPPILHGNTPIYIFISTFRI
jgi:hypothetical protein